MRDFQVISSNLSIHCFFHPLCLARNLFILCKMGWGGGTCPYSPQAVLTQLASNIANIRLSLCLYKIQTVPYVHFSLYFTNSCLPSHFLSISLLYFLWYTILPYPCRAVVVIWLATWLDAHFQQSVCANRRIIKYRPHSNQIVVLQNYKI